MNHFVEFASPRLRLIGTNKALLFAELQGHDALSVAIESIVPRSWPPEHHDSNTINWILRALDESPSSQPWGLYYLVLQASSTVVGVCGFKGPPNSEGHVEVGYSVVEEFRCRGLATEAVKVLIRVAFDKGVSGVAAETFPSLMPSLRVMEKCGMTSAGDGAEPGTVRYILLRS